ncbi:Lrp/AsnC family transcriptional regulator [Carboxylicivirga linearis]|uniref:Lrp/AsnC family transcriptional regulator n=1 Tax=Carboxylicivirga linearis TaxID=1628157 RepID=A0ABS5JQV3_9BACT|nr:Lrp/AsnC family transcriptional regulator [Carboxylicivirga linearis]MBS2097263.1 Lrp/AsnC family transcriptional regulator [Carboxylicivirga linearis]
MIRKEKYSAIQLDATDKKLIMLLQKDAKMTTKQLAHHLNLSITPVFERIKRLERNGVIEKYVAIINKEKVGKELIAFCNVSLKEHSHDIIRDFEKSISELPEVLECHHIAGMFDYTLKVVTEDMETYHHFVYNKLSSVNNVGNVQSSFVMREIKTGTELHLE